jgi:hypothetical protein
MVVSVSIIAVSLLLFAYWFRYSCALLLRNRTTSEGVADNRFHFASVQERLKTAEDLDPLWAALQRDYELLNYLLRHAAGLEMESIEDRLLVLDYRVMQGWYRLTHTAAPRQARRALAEMADVLGVMSQRMSRQRAAGNEA